MNGMKTIGKRLENIRKAFEHEVLITLACDNEGDIKILSATATVNDEEDIDVDDNVDGDGPVSINRNIRRYFG